MLRLKIAGQYVDLPNDFSFTMNMKSPVFNDIGSYSYPFKIPGTARNKSILGFMHRIENTSDPYQVFDGYVEWNGISLFSGSVKLRVLSSGYYEGTFYEAESDFYYKRKALSLQQIDFGTLSFDNAAARWIYINNCIEKYYPDCNVGFPRIWDPEYFDPVTTDNEQKYLNYYRNGVLQLVTSTGNRTVIVPMLYMRFVLQKIFSRMSYILDDSFFQQDSSFNKLLLYNSVDCNSLESGPFSYPEDKLLLNYHLPRMNLGDFIKEFENFFHARFFVNNNTKTVVMKSIDSIIKSGEYADLSSQLLSINADLSDQFAGYRLSMELDSDDSAITGLSDGDNLRLESVKDPVDTITDLPLWPGADEGDIRYVKSQKAYYKMLSGIWEEYDINDFVCYTKWLYGQITGEEITSKFSTLWDVPNSLCEIGNKQQNWKAITPRLFFNYALYDNGSFFAMAGKSNTPSRRLFYDNETGLFNMQFKSFAEFMQNTKQVKMTLNLGLIKLLNFDFSLKYMVGGVHYLFKDLQVTIKKDRILPATVTAFCFR